MDEWKARKFIFLSYIIILIIMFALIVYIAILKEKDNSFTGILKSIVQTFDGKYFYPTIEEQASNLFYFVIKGHPFIDGNKRIGAFLFVWFLEKNKHLLNQ